MVDQRGQAEIRSLDIQKVLKGFALSEFIFKNQVTVTSTNATEIRWYQETAADLTATSPSKVANIARGAKFTRLSPTYTRNTSYIQKYGAEDKIDYEDVVSSDVPIVARTLLRLTRAVSKQVDTHIFNILTESQSVTNINSVTTTSVGGDQWDAASGQNPVKDVTRAIRLIAQNSYSGEFQLWVSPQDYESLVVYAYGAGAQAPMIGERMITDAVLTKFAGAKVIMNENVVADYAVVSLPAKAVTYYQHTPLTNASIVDEGIGTTYRVWEEGVAVLTDPKAVTLIIDTQT